MVAGSYDFKKILRVLNKPLIELQITPEKDPRSQLQTSYRGIFDILEKNNRFNESNLI